MTIPDAVRARDLVGYGRTPPAWEWPDGAQVVVNLVLVYEEGSEYSVRWGDDRNDGWGEYAEPSSYTSTRLTTTCAPSGHSHAGGVRP